MGANPQYKVNEDGSVTRVDGGGDSGNNNNNRRPDGGGDNNSSNTPGCIWAVIIIAIIIGVTKGCNGSDDSNDAWEPAEEVVAEPVEEEVVWAEEAVAEEEVTGIDVSSDRLYFSADGGSQDIYVYASDDDWYVSTGTYNWGHLSRYGNTLTVSIDPNPDTSERTDYFILRLNDDTQEVNITQSGKSQASPTATINQVWVDHNVYNNGYKGLKIHASFDVKNMKDRTIYMYTRYYYSDNITPLQSRQGGKLYYSSSFTIPYEQTSYSDNWHFMPYNNLNMQPGYGSIDLTFDVVIEDANGNILAIDEDNHFTLTEG